MNLIEVNELRKNFGNKRVLSHLNLTVPAGSVFGLLGTNGCGKTTLIRILAGLDFPDGGSMRVMRESDPEKYRMKIGFMLDDLGWNPAETGLQNLETQAILSESPNPDFVSILASVGLEKAGKQKVKSYSLGMKRRLGIAGLLIKPYPLYVLDEPSNGLDLEGQLMIRNQIQKWQNAGATVVVTTHYLADFEPIFTHMALMKAGKIEVQGTKKELLASYGDLETLYLNKTKA